MASSRFYKKIEKYFEKATTEELETLYFMLHTELTERDLVREAENQDPNEFPEGDKL
jgi:hypothetical protein